MVDDQPLELVEHGQVRGVRRVPAVGASRRHRVDREHSALQEPDLYRRGMRAQKHAPGLAVVDVKGVDRAPRGMVLRDVQRVEVAPARSTSGPSAIS